MGLVRHQLGWKAHHCCIAQKDFSMKQYSNMSAIPFIAEIFEMMRAIVDMLFWWTCSMLLLNICCFFFCNLNLNISFRLKWNATWIQDKCNIHSSWPYSHFLIYWSKWCSILIHVYVYLVVVFGQEVVC